MFIDSMMEVANNFSSIFSSDEGADGKGTIAQILYSNPEAAQVTGIYFISIITPYLETWK